MGAALARPRIFFTRLLGRVTWMRCSPSWAPTTLCPSSSILEISTLELRILFLFLLNSFFISYFCILLSKTFVGSYWIYRNKQTQFQFNDDIVENCLTSSGSFVFYNNMDEIEINYCLLALSLGFEMVLLIMVYWRIYWTHA